MFSLIEARHYRCLRYVRQPLAPFHVLVGPNASGKTTFLDVVAFLSQLVSQGLDEALNERATTFSDLVWWHEDGGFELAVEAVIPISIRKQLENAAYDTIRYEVGIFHNNETQQVEIKFEQGTLLVSENMESKQRRLFPLPPDAPETIVQGTRKNARRLFTKVPGGNDNYYAEAQSKQGRWRPGFRLGPRKSTLGNLPEDEVNYPVSSWFKQLIANGVEQIALNSRSMRYPSPPGRGTKFKPDGSNLPWVVSKLREDSPAQLESWVKHLQTALPELQSITTATRPEDRYRYIFLTYRGGLVVPSWMASDGTLRLLALTLPAYLDDMQGTYLIEEPENGIHPRAVETMFDSLSSVYDAQVLMATHSPVILGIAQASQVLCFAKTEEGATDIVRGDEHPQLSSWHGDVDLGTLFASGVLG